MSQNEYSTKRLQIAIFLHATQTLPFLRTDAMSDGKLRFVFLDEDRIGSKVELDFDRGATVAARDLFSSQTFIRRIMSDTENRKIGESENDRPAHRR